MALVFARNWWSLAIRGLLAVIFGVLAFLAPGAALTGLTLAFGAYALVAGSFAIAFAVRAGRADERWGAVLFEGIVGVVAGIFTFLMPTMTALVLVTLIAAWSILTGAAQIATAIRLRKTIRHEWFLALAGIASIAFGVILLIAPVAGAIVLTWWIGAYALVFGILQIVLAFKLRGWGRREDVPGAVPRAA
jgi:uncharacterized membrane protein HdeD (DUF308 family)